MTYYVVPNGETSSGLTLIDQGMEVFSGGTALDSTIGKNCQLLVYDGGTASGATIQKGGRMYVYGSAGTADGITVQKGGQLLGYGNKDHRVIRNVTVESGGSARSGDLVGGSMDVLPGGWIAETTVGANGRLYLSGKADSFTLVASGGIAYVDGGSVYRPSVLSGGTMYVNSGGAAKQAALEFGGRMNVMSGGKVNSARIERNAVMSVYTGGTATKIDWTPGKGIVQAAPGATVTFVSKYSGIYDGSNGAFVDRTGPADRKIGDNASMYVMSGGKPAGYTATGTGRVYIHSGGMTDALTVDNDAWAYVSSGGIANATKLKNDGELHVEYKGLASGTQIQKDGVMVVSSGGTACRTEAGNGGLLEVCNDGVASGVDIAKGGSMTVSSATLAGRTEVRKGGSMTIRAGTKLSGQIILKDGAAATLAQKGMIVFDIGTGANLGGGAPVRINALSSIKDWNSGNGYYAVSVAKSASGTTQSFLLAKGAAGFGQTITLQNEAGDSEDLSVGGGSVKFGKAEYSLSLINGALILNRGKSGKQLSISAGVADADDGWNNDLLDGNTLNDDVCGDGKGIKIADGVSSGQLDETKAVCGLYDNYVGFGDGADFAKLSLTQPAKLNFTVSATGNVKFAVCSLTNKNGKWVRKEIKSLTLSPKKGELSTGDLRLKRLVGETGTGYYISARSTDAKSGGMAWYKVSIESTVCASDFGTNDTLLMDKKTVNPDLRTTAVSGSGKTVDMEVSREGDSVKVEKKAYGKTYNSFVGFGDEIDYAEITFDAAGACSFSIDMYGTEKASAKFTVYSLTRSDSSKAWTKKSLATKTIKFAGVDHVDGVQIEGVRIGAATGGNGRYFVSMQAANDAAKKGEVYYRTVASISSVKTASALAMPETASVASALAMPDSLSFGQYDTDVLAGASADAYLDSASDKLFGETNTGLLA